MDTNTSQKTTGGPSVTCPNCKNLISFIDYPRSTHFGCGECCTYFQYSDTGNHQIIRTFNSDNQDIPNFPFGTVFRKKSTLISFVTKRDPKEDFYWSEYLFFHPDFDYYITLVDVDGFWLMVYKAPDQQSYESDKANTGMYSSPFMSYQFEVVYAEGEFNWDVVEDENLTTFEYKKYDQLLINEVGNGRSEWYKGEFLSPVNVADSLKVPMAMLSPRKYFTPADFYPSWRTLLAFTGIVLVFFFLYSIILTGFQSSSVIYKNNFQCSPDTSIAKTYENKMANSETEVQKNGLVMVKSSWDVGNATISPDFEINKKGVIEIDISTTELNNNWLDVEILLVNNKTGEEFEATAAMEAYHGIDDGESWSEDNREKTISFGGVPKGTYHLNLYPSIPDNVQKNDLGGYDLSYNIVVKYGSTSGNFITIFILILLYPFIQYIRKANYESKARNTKIYGN